MINKDLITEFLHQELSYVEDIVCDSFELYRNVIDIKIRNISNTVHGFGEIVKLERYVSWLSEKRNDKLDNIIK
jgi:hypothetical protein